MPNAVVVEQIARLERVWDRITEHPEQHDQGAFGAVTDCGTVHCIAGWLVVDAGWSCVGMADWYDATGGSVQEYDTALPRFAAELIGVHLSTSWALLFSEALSRSDIRNGIDLLRKSRGLRPRTFG